MGRRDISDFIRTVSVSNANHFKNAMDRAQAGDVIELADGNYNIGNYMMSRRGTESNPIVIRAVNPQRAAITGGGKLTITGEWVYVEGLLFNTTAVRILDTKCCRITRYLFRACTRDYGAIEIQGSKECRIDHNEMEDIQRRGLSVDPNNPSSDAAAVNHNQIENNLIDFNYLHDFPIGTTKRNGQPVNGGEPVNLGRSGQDSLVPAKTLLEFNLFEDVRCDEEVISVKTSWNTIQFNTFIDSVATAFYDLNLRHNAVLGNTFIDFRRLNIRGDNHKILGNRMILMNHGDKNGSICACSGNVFNTVESWNQGSKFTGNHPAARFCVIAGNVIGGRVEIGLTSGAGMDEGPPLNSIGAINTIHQNNITGLNTRVGTHTGTRTRGFMGQAPVPIRLQPSEVGLLAPDPREDGGSLVPTNVPIELAGLTTITAVGDGTGRVTVPITVMGDQQGEVAMAAAQLLDNEDGTQLIELIVRFIR